jgi:hypothetical protein
VFVFTCYDGEHFLFLRITGPYGAQGLANPSSSICLRMLFVTAKKIHDVMAKDKVPTRMGTQQPDW